MEHLTPTGRSRAASYIARVNLEIVKAAMARRQAKAKKIGHDWVGRPWRLEVVKGQSAKRPTAH